MAARPELKRFTQEAGRITSAPYLLWNRNNPFTGGVPSLERKVVRLINSTDSLSALGFLL